MPSCLHNSEMLTASGRSGLNSMIFRRVDADNVFGTSHSKRHGPGELAKPRDTCKRCRERSCKRCCE